MPPDPPSLVCLCKLDIHVTPLLKILATGLIIIYSGKTQPLTAENHDTTDNSDCPSVHFNIKQPLNSGHPAIQYNNDPDLADTR